jgi:hypothetical protein
MSINYPSRFCFSIGLFDGIWKDHMEQEDFEGMLSCYDNALNKPLFNHLKEILRKLDKKVSF